MSSITEVLKKGVSFKNGIYRFSGTLTDHVCEIIDNALKRKEYNYFDVEKEIYEFTRLLGQFDYLELPNGTTFKKEFEPKKQKEGI